MPYSYVFLHIDIKIFCFKIKLYARKVIYMKKIFKNLIILTTIFSSLNLYSCNNSSSSDSLKDTKTKLKERFKVDDFLKVKQDELIYDYYGMKYDEGLDGVLVNGDPFINLTKKPEYNEYYLQSKNKVDDVIYFSQHEYYFNYNGYKYYSNGFLEEPIYLYPNVINDKYTFSFRYITSGTNQTLYPSFADVLEYNGTYGYVFKVCQLSFFTFYLTQLAYNTPNFPFDIYCVEDTIYYSDGKTYNGVINIFLIPQDDKFSKEIVNKIYEIGENSYLVDLEAIKNSK